MARILLIDDDVDFSWLLQRALAGLGHEVKYLERATEGPDALAKEPFDVVLVDNRMPGMTGIEFLQALQQQGSSTLVILMTSHGTTDTAITAMNLGAFDYVIKPNQVEELVAELDPLIIKAAELAQAAKQHVRLPGDGDGDAAAPSDILLRGQSRPMQEVYKLIGKVAGSDTPLLIRGETGVGKELVAQAIHAHSRRKSRPFVAINCTALNEHLLDDELFGHEPGSFTDAAKLRKGVFEYAHGGTLFLDEVGDMPPPLQAKLLRVLENQEVQRIGSNESIKVDVRVLSATHRQLDSAIRDGQFREDLYYRLAGVTIRLPALRDRGGDLRLLAEYFLAKGAAAGRATPALHESFWQKLTSYSWPGNVRQLQNSVRRALLMCRGNQLVAGDLEFVETTAPDEPSRPSDEEALAGLRKAIRWALASGQANVAALLGNMLERELIALTLAEVDNNQAQAAKRLGMARGTIIEKVKKYGLK